MTSGRDVTEDVHMTVRKGADAPELPSRKGMASNSSLGSGPSLTSRPEERYCQRGCGRSLAGRRQNTRYCGTPECAQAARERNRCSETTSATTCRCHEASGAHLPSLPSVTSASRLPARAWTRPNCSSGSVSARTLAPVTRTAPALPSREQVADEVDDLWRTAESRETRSRGGYNAGWRCWGCRKFISGPTVTCQHCGQMHGGIYHEAYATR